MEIYLEVSLHRGNLGNASDKLGVVAEHVLTQPLTHRLHASHHTHECRELMDHFLTFLGN